MKLILSTESKRLSVRLSDPECDTLFKTLAAEILSIAPAEVVHEEDLIVRRCPGCKATQEISSEPGQPHLSAPATQTIPTAVPEPEHVDAAPTELAMASSSAKYGSIQIGHTGFLYLRCQKCGEAYGFLPKTPITQYFCKKCSALTPLPGKLTPVKFKCECGRELRYDTNITDKMFEISCLDCGTPNAVVLNEKSGRYEQVKG